MDEIIPGSRHISAEDHIHAGKGRHKDDAYRVVDARERDGEKPGRQTNQVHTKNCPNFLKKLPKITGNP